MNLAWWYALFCPSSFLFLCPSKPLDMCTNVSESRVESVISWSELLLNSVVVKSSGLVFERKESWLQAEFEVTPSNCVCKA